LPGQQLATTDSLVEGTHFLPSLSSYEDIGWKAVAVNLSDIAAMGGYPEHLLVAISMPPAFTREQFTRLYTGIVDCANTYKTRIVGGDLTSSPQLTLGLTVLGSWHENGCLKRSGARPGDLVIATGDFGASAAGLWYLQNETSGRSIRPLYVRTCGAHRRPVPRLADAWSLVKRSDSRGALMDSSDGLADALCQISWSSNVLIEVDLELVPIHDETRELATLAGVDVNNWALYGGEDYQLVGCLRSEIWDNYRHELSPSFSVIGRVLEGRGVKLKIGSADGPELELSRTFQQIRF
jgi:thiamine-monophosphate kinase